MATPNGTAKDAPLTGPIQTITAGRKPRSLVALAAAIAGSVLTIVGFFTWILGALDGTGTSAGTLIGQVLFFVGLALGALAVDLAIWSLVTGAPKLLPVAAIAVAFSPVLFLLGLAMR